MTTMPAAVIDQWGKEPVLREVPIPVPKPGEALIRVRACGAGRTVLNAIDGDLTNCAPELLPRIPGHEVAGEVAAVGSGVFGLKEGDRVVAYFYVTCGRCRMCIRGQQPLCQNFGGFIGAHRDGGYARYASIPARNCFPIPPKIGFVEATAIPDAILTPLHIARTRARITPDDRVVVLGAGGGVGIHMVQMAHRFGAEVWGVEANLTKRRAILECGARDVVEFQETPPQAMYEMIDGATVVIDTVGRPATFHWAGKVLGPAGTVVLITTFPETATTISQRELVFKEQNVMGSRYGSHYELEWAIDMVAREQIRPIVTEVVPLGQFDRLHRMIQSGLLVGRGAVVPE